MKIGFVKHKGGVGASTTVAWVGEAFAEHTGRSVALADCDPQGTLTEWARRAEMRDGGLRSTVVPIDAGTGGLTIEEQIDRLADDHDIVLIDTPPGNVDTNRAVIRASDMVVIPTQPGEADLIQVWETIALCQEEANTPRAVLLTMTRRRTVMLEASQKALEMQNTTVLPTSIPLREALRRSFGHRPTGGEWHGYDELAETIGAIHGALI